MQTTSPHAPGATPPAADHHDDEYAQLERLIAQRCSQLTGPLFTTDATGLFEAWLAGIPEDQRQHYNCRCCRRFVERYCSLAQINTNGELRPSLLVGGHVGDFFEPSVSEMAKIVNKAKITGVFLSGDPIWGTPANVAGPGSKCVGKRWSHLHGTNNCIFRDPLLTAEQVMAEKLQDYILLKKGLADYPMEAVAQAVRVLEANAVDRSEKALATAQWLLKLHQALGGPPPRMTGAGRGQRYNNLVWLATATAPKGWCHFGTMLGTLLDDVVKGLPFESIRARWNEKMSPLKYQRPDAPPKDGTIEQANRIMEKLQAEGALARRVCRLDEVTALWRPKPPETEGVKYNFCGTGLPGSGTFDHLRRAKPSTIKEVELPAKAICWDRFRDMVLPGALGVEVMLPHAGPYYGMTTAVNADAPPMLQWDGLTSDPKGIFRFARNPAAWYFYVAPFGGGDSSTAASWGLAPGWCAVDAICLKPCHWQQSDKFAHQGSGVFFCLGKSRDSRNDSSAIFPETLRSEWHGIRSVIEAHSRRSKLEPLPEGVVGANGIALTDKGGLTLRVRSAKGTEEWRVTL
jgi:hypothetical protein